MSPDQLQQHMNIFLKKLVVNEKEQMVIMQCTIDQADSSEWIEQRRKRIGASIFGKICRMLPHTSCEKTVSSMLYKTNAINTPAVNWGKQHEEDAISATEEQMDLKIEKCGLFIDLENAFLCATPDGLVGDDTVVEVKCPYGAREMTPDEAIFDKLITIYV